MANTTYADSKSRAVRYVIKLKSFLQASIDFNNDRTNSAKRAKIGKMLMELSHLRNIVEDDIERMLSAFNYATAPAEITDHTESQKLDESFDHYYYELVAYADVHKFSLSPPLDVASSSFSSQPNVHNLSAFQFPKRKFPIFSGVLTEWQDFESLSLTAINYNSTWKILSDRYGNKRDLARIHLDALLANQSVKSNDAASIKTQINTLLEHTVVLDNLGYVTRQWSPLLVHIAEKHLNYDLGTR